ncbi:MBL fold metallo-hydrolase [bacterium]|nr:MBL fold metallo-hydrolase [bacterium]
MIEITFLGTGTSHGVPEIGCRCPICLSEDSRDKRFRSSILITYCGKNIIVDTGPDFRSQVLREGISKVDAVIITHLHSDHITGLDDLRKYNCKSKDVIPIYSKHEYLEELKCRYGYINFSGTYKTGAVPQLKPIVVEKKFNVFGLEFEVVPILHGDDQILGLRFHDILYLTDCSGIPEESEKIINNPEIMILGALRDKPHYKHFSFFEALEQFKKFSPKKGFITHVSHKLSHAYMTENSPDNVFPAYDGLKITVE